MSEFKTQKNQVQLWNQKEKQIWLLDPWEQWAQGIPVKKNYVNKVSTAKEVLFEKQKAHRCGYLSENESCWTENLVTCKNLRKVGLYTVRFTVTAIWLMVVNRPSR